MRLHSDDTVHEAVTWGYEEQHRWIEINLMVEDIPHLTDLLCHGYHQQKMIKNVFIPHGDPSMTRFGTHLVLALRCLLADQMKDPFQEKIMAVGVYLVTCMQPFSTGPPYSFSPCVHAYHMYPMPIPIYIITLLFTPPCTHLIPLVHSSYPHFHNYTILIHMHISIPILFTFPMSLITRLCLFITFPTPDFSIPISLIPLLYIHVLYPHAHTPSPSFNTP